MKKLIAALFALTLLATACGGSTDIIAADIEGASDDGGSEDNGGSDDTGASDDNGGSDDGGGSFDGDFCALAQEREDAESTFDSVNVFIPSEFEAAWNENIRLLERAIVIAPDAIRADLELIRAEIGPVDAALREAGFDVAAIFADDPDADFDETPEAEAAGERIDAYVRDVCGIDVDANEDGGPTDEELLQDLQDSGNEEQLVQTALESVGFTPEQAACVASQITLDDLLAIEDQGPSGDVLDILIGCGVDVGTMGDLGGGMPQTEGDDDAFDGGAPTELPPAAQEAFLEALVDAGLSPDEAECFAFETFQGEVAGDVLAALENCGIPLSRLSDLSGALDG